MKPRIGTYVDQYGLKFKVISVNSNEISAEWIGVENKKFTIPLDKWHNYAEISEFIGADHNTSNTITYHNIHHVNK